MMNRLLICLFLVAGALGVSTALDARYQAAHADGSAAVLDAGIAAGSGSAYTPSNDIADPTASPGAAFDELKQAKKAGWSVAVFVGLLMLSKLLGKASSLPLVGSKLAWLGKGKAAVLVAWLGATSAACYNAIAAGGAWQAVGWAAIVALAHAVDAGGAA